MIPSLHNVTNSCTETSLNTWESTSTSLPPSIDVLNSSNLRRGMITSVPNLGLQQRQSKKMSYNHYNSGCLNPQGCVNSGGVTCPGSVRQGSPEINSMYKFLNAPLMADNSEYYPPKYMMGWKAGSVNSVSGWEKNPNSETFVWQGQNPPVGEKCNG